MTSLTFQNFIIFFLGFGVWTPPDPIKFKCCIHILEILECLEIHMSGTRGLEAKHVGTRLMGQLKMCHLKAEKNELNHSGCLLSQILSHCFVCLCYVFSFYFITPLCPYYVCSNPIMIMFSVDGHHLGVLYDRP